MTSLAESPPSRNTSRNDKAKALRQTTDYPPVALGRLDDRTGWRWLDPKPDGWFDWTLTALLVAIACVPILLVYCPICWAIRAIRKAGA